MSRRGRNEQEISELDLERMLGAAKLLDAYTQFGVSLLKGEQPTRPPRIPESRRKYETAN